MAQGYDLLELLDYIDPASLDYTAWVSVGMALKQEGHSVEDWDNWSRRDPKRFHAGVCRQKWDSFHGAPSPVSGGTIVQLARGGGWHPAVRDGGGHELDWEDIIGTKDDHIIVNQGWVEGRDISEPDDWDPAGQLILYLETLFDKSENVGYVCESWEKDGRWLPTKGAYDRTSDTLIRELKKCNGDIGAVLGDYNKQAGAWIRFNPLDGQGVKNDNVTAFRYALVESDNIEIDKQNAIIRELELPVACLVHSGKKSLHAIVRIEADTYEEYRKRVDYLYTVCQKNGMKIDTQNRNPSRLSRMPGIMRNGRKQFIVNANIGKSSWAEWFEWIDSVNDDLPDPENMADAWDNLPELSAPLIDGILRQGHKMLLAGPSKAGKSYALIQLCCAIAEGRTWLNWPCARGRVLYVNLELDRASCLHRFRDVYQALGWEPANLRNIDIWNLRGKSVPMDKLAPKLIRRAAKKHYIAIVIDPIYKVITGDENSADQMARFCNQFDRVCSELGAAVIYCHHHSKGQQGQKRSMDRASGSGVFARDPDVLLDLIELELTDAAKEAAENSAVCDACKQWLGDNAGDDWDDHVGQDDMLVSSAFIKAMERVLTPEQFNNGLIPAVEQTRRTAASYSAWRIEGTLREFPKFDPIDLWFAYPIHRVDKVGVLSDIDADGEPPPWKKAVGKHKEKAKSRRKDARLTFENMVQSCNFGSPPTVEMLCESLGLARRTVEGKMKEYGYVSQKGLVCKCEDAPQET